MCVCVCVCTVACRRMRSAQQRARRSMQALRAHMHSAESRYACAHAHFLAANLINERTGLTSGALYIARDRDGVTHPCLHRPTRAARCRCIRWRNFRRLVPSF